MDTIKKLILILLVIVAVIGAGLLLLGGKIDELIAQEIERHGSAALGTEVSVTNVVTDIGAGSATIQGFTIANPDGFAAQNAIEIASFVAAVDYSSQEIELIEIENPTINAELLDGRSNFQTLLNNIPESEDAASSGEEAESIELTIKKLVVKQAQVNMLARDTELGEQSFTMADLVISNLSGTPEQISKQIATLLSKHISGQVTRHLAGQVKEQVLEKIDEKAKKVSNALRDKLRAKLRNEKPSVDP